jgi:hypothetical protein
VVCALQLGFVESDVVAWGRGEWFEYLIKGQPEGYAADDWKGGRTAHLCVAVAISAKLQSCLLRVRAGPYHTGRAVLTCIEMLNTANADAQPRSQGREEKGGL